MNGPFVRRLRVVEVAADRASLEPASGACEGCTACSGRCHGILSGLSAAGRMRIARDALPPALAAGDEVLLEFDPGALARRGWRVYGLPLAGLLLGACASAFALPAAGPARDAGVALGALVGVALGFVVARLIGGAATPPYRFASFPSPRNAIPPCEPRPES